MTSRARNLGLAALAALVFAVLPRTWWSTSTSDDLLLQLLSLGAFAGLQAVLAALRTSDLTRVLYGYLATPYFAHRALGEVWLGDPTEPGAGTFAPLLLGDAVLLLVLVRARSRVPLVPLAAAAILTLPAFAFVGAPDFHVGAFAYQWLAIVRLAVVVWFVRGELRREDAHVRPVDVAWHLGLIFAAMALVSGSIALATGSRFGWPGWGANVYANALAAVSVLTAAHAWVRWRWRMVVVSAVGVFGMVGSGTRVALVAFAGVLALMVVARVIPRHMRRIAVPTVFTVLIAAVLAFPGVLFGAAAELNPRLGVIGGIPMSRDIGLPEFAAAVGRESSVRTRFELWRASAAMVAAYPATGVGWGQWNWRKADFGVEFDVLLDPHNGYVWLVAEGGLVVTAFVALVLLAFVARVRPSPSLLAVLVVLLLEMTNANVQKAPFAVLFAVLVGTALAHRRGTTRA